MTQTATLQVTACLEALAAIRAFVQETGARWGAPQEPLTDLVRAVDEAATNIVMHGECSELPVTVTMVRGDGRLIVTLTDQGRPYDPTMTPPPDPSVAPWERTGGLGVYLMRELTDEIHYRVPAGGGNELTLVKVWR